MSITAGSSIVCQGHTRPVVDLKVRASRACLVHELTVAGFTGARPFTESEDGQTTHRHTRRTRAHVARACQFAHTADNLDIFITACHDKTAQVRWADSGNWIGSLVGHQGAVWGATVDDAGRRAATASADFTAKVWDLSTGVELASFQHTHVVKAVDFNAAGQLLTCGLEKAAFVFDAQSEQRTAVLPHDAGVLHALWTDGGTMVATGGADGVVRRWDTRAPLVPVASLALRAAASTGVADLEYSGDALVATAGRKLHVLDARSLAVRAEVDAGVDVNAGSLSPDGALLAAGAQDLCCHVFDVATGREVAVFKGHHGPLFACRWLLAGAQRQTRRRVATASEDGLVRIWTCDC